jgi:hypothetical protein
MMLLNNKEPIFIVGYPRSGNNWIARLLGDLLNSPIGNYKSAVPISLEGLNRPGKYQITVLHMHIQQGTECNTFIVDAYTACPDAWDGEKVVIIQRDPRDIAVSAWKFFDLKTLDESLNRMTEAECASCIPWVSWRKFTQEWDECPIPHVKVTYEGLIQNTEEELRRIINELAIQSDNLDFAGCTERQSFDVRKLELAQNGDSYLYGKELQLKNLRLGKVGDWKNYFTKEQREFARQHFGVSDD